MGMNLNPLYKPLLPGGNLGTSAGGAVGAALPTPTPAPASDSSAQAPAAQALQAPAQPTDSSALTSQAQTPTQTTAPTAQQAPTAMPTTAQQGQPPTSGAAQAQPQQPTVFAQMPSGVMLSPGSTMFAQVAGQNEQGAFLLQMGEHLVTAQTDQPLQVGQNIQLQVQSGQDGQVQMQLVETPFSPMESGELANNLTELNLPVTESSMELAQSMVEHGMPLTGESFSTTLSQTALPANSGPNPPPVDARVSAVVFLQQNQMPVTESNMMLLSNFLAANPNLGAQLFAVNGELQKLQKTLDNDSLEMLEEITSVLGGEGALDEAKSPGQPAQPATPPKLYNMAKQAGIENNWSNLYGTDEEKPDIAAYLRERRSSMSEDGGFGELMGLLKGIEDNLDAQKLINQGRPPQEMGFYYLQIPFSLFNRDGAQVWVRYEKKRNGRKDVDPDDARVEFLVTTEHLGDLFFVLELKQGSASVEVSVSRVEVREFVELHTPALLARIRELGWNVGALRVLEGAPKVDHPWVERTDFASVQSCNVNA